MAWYADRDISIEFHSLFTHAGVDVRGIVVQWCEVRNGNRETFTTTRALPHGCRVPGLPVYLALKEIQDAILEAEARR